MRWLVIMLALLFVQVEQVATEPPMVLYEPPLGTAVIDPFRPPAHIGAPGNRGLQYGFSEGQPIRTAAAGQVIFAGPVAGRKVITVRHGDGVRTTYSGLNDIWVTRGQYVSRSIAMGIGSTGFHFGARVGDHYLDPQILLDASQPTERARLVPPPDQ